MDQDHPEYELIKTIIIGDFAGVDEDNAKEYYDALKQLSPDGKILLEKERKEELANFERQEKWYAILRNMPEESTKQ